MAPPGVSTIGPKPPLPDGILLTALTSSERTGGRPLDVRRVEPPSIYQPPAPRPNNGEAAAPGAKPAKAPSMSRGEKGLLIGAGALAVGGIIVSFFAPPIGLAMLAADALILAGCSDPCKGVGTTACDGSEAVGPDPVVTFKDGYATAREQESARGTLESFETPLRQMNPRLFCKFNGWHVTDEQSDDTTYASYDPCTKKVSLNKYAGARQHEFCHHISDWYGIYHDGLIVSKTPEWSAISCFDNGWDNSLPENCPGVFLQIPENGRRYMSAEEEWANSCGAMLEDPVGALYTNSGITNTLEQAVYVAGVIGVPEETIRSVAANGILKKPEQHAVSGGVENGLEVPRFLAGWLKRSGRTLETFAMNGAYAFLEEADSLSFYTPPSNGNGWRGRFITLPIKPNAGSVSMDYNNGTLSMQEGFTIHSIALNAGGAWTLSKKAQLPLSASQDVFAFVDSQPAVFGDRKYWIEDPKGNEIVLNYPPELPSLTGTTNGKPVVKIVHAEGKSYLSIRRIPISPLGWRAMLFELKRSGDEIRFTKVFEAQTPAYASVPHFYNGQWYIFDHINNSHMTNVADTRVSAPVMLRIENGGSSVTPIELRYAPESADDLYIRMVWLYDASIMSNGDSFIGYSGTGVSGHLDLSPSFIKFQIQ